MRIENRKIHRIEPIHTLLFMANGFYKTQISKKSVCGVRLLPLSFSILRRLIGQYFESRNFESLLANQRENSGGEGDPTI